MTEDQRLAVQLLQGTGFKVLAVKGRTITVTWPEPKQDCSATAIAAHHERLGLGSTRVTG